MAPKISSSEWEVMSVIWTRGPLAATDVFDALSAGHGWKQKTVNTFLTRLVAKGALSADRSGKAFIYTSLVGREKCVKAESDSFLQRVFQGATGNLVLHFCEHADLTPQETRELEQLIRSKRVRK
jgi:BlaI family transcriptional regulator, penicillinase repressor